MHRKTERILTRGRLLPQIKNSLIFNRGHYEVAYDDSGLLFQSQTALSYNVSVRKSNVWTSGQSQKSIKRANTFFTNTRS